MKPTARDIKEMFDEFNRKMFGGRLPEIPIALCSVTSFVGQFRSKLRKLPDGGSEPYDCVLRFSTAFDLERREIEDTVIHEMIHYFIAVNGLRDRTAHGPLFKALMASINENHGRNIRISRPTTREELETARTASSKWHVIAVIYFRKGDLGVKVLPRVVPKIIEYYRRVSGASNVEKVELFLHNDAFFNRYPTSTAMRCQSISAEEVAQHLGKAHRLRVEGKKLVQG